MRIKTELQAVERFHKKYKQFKGTSLYGILTNDPDNDPYWIIYTTEGQMMVGIVYQDGSTVRF